MTCVEIGYATGVKTQFKILINQLCLPCGCLTSLCLSAFSTYIEVIILCVLVDLLKK